MPGMDTTIRVGEPRELLAYLPHQLGFHPRESAVVVSIRDPRGRVGLVARVDLADLGDPVAGPQVARTLIGHLATDGAARTVLVLYTQDDPRGSGPGTELARAAAYQFGAAAGWTFGGAEVWAVVGTGYLRLACEDDLCCPPGGRPLSDLQATAVGAHMVVAGSCVLDSRDDLARVPAAGAPARRNAARAAARWERRRDEAASLGDPDAVAVALVAWRAAGLALWRDLVAAAADGSDVGPAALGRMAVGLRDTRLRDAALVACVPGSGDAPERCLVAPAGALDTRVTQAVEAIVDPRRGVPPPDDVGVHEAVLRQVAAHARTRDQAPALTLLAVLAWWQGDGARAAALVERASVLDPVHRLARLLGDMLDAGLPPGWVARARSTG